nr:hypothetical protein [Tanacetum cinerariifolium]
MKDAEIVQQEIKEKEELTDAEKTADLTKEITEQPLTSTATNNTNPTTIPTPPINTEAPSIPKITSLIAVQLRVAKLEQDVSELKKTDHSAAAMASIQSQVPTVVDKYLGTKLNDALLKALERHTTYLIDKYFGLPAPESSKKQESKKSIEEIIIIKWEQDEKKQMSTYTIKSIDKAALKEFNLKSAIFKAMHENKSTNRNPTNYRLFHALMKALIEDENAIDKDVSDTVKDHKRKHDSDDDDDDDEGRSAGPNQGKTSKKRRSKESESAKKPSTTKETSKGKAPKKDSKTGKSAPVEEPIRRTPIMLIFQRRIGKEKLNKSDFEGPTFMMVKGFHENNITLQFQMEEFHKLLIDQDDLVNPEGHRIVPDITKSLPLRGPPEDHTIFYKPRAVIYKDKKEQKKMMRINEVHKFSDGTLTRIRDKLDFMVKDFKLFEYNKGMESRICKINQRVLRIILVILPEHLSDANAFTMKMKVLLEPSSNKLLVGEITFCWWRLKREMCLCGVEILERVVSGFVEIVWERSVGWWKCGVSLGCRAIWILADGFQHFHGLCTSLIIDGPLCILVGPCALVIAVGWYYVKWGVKYISVNGLSRVVNHHNVRMIPQLVIILEGEMCTSGVSVWEGAEDFSRNIVSNSRVTPSWREIVSLTFNEAGFLHVNWMHS